MKSENQVVYIIKLHGSVKLILWALVFALFANALPSFDLVPNAVADDYDVISRILYCIDGSTISNGRLSTYCNG